MAANELNLNPETGVFESVPTSGIAGAPKRSWKRGDKSANIYDATFEYEGTTVFINTLSDDEWAGIEARDEEVVAALQVLQDKTEAAQKAKGLTPEARKAASAELLAESDAINARARKHHAALVQSCIVGWKGGDAPPFSKEALRELPYEIIQDFALAIMGKSRLSKEDGDFLASS